MLATADGQVVRRVRRIRRSQPLDDKSTTHKGAFVGVACIRSANRHYHLLHPDLHLETSTTVLVVWATLVAGVIGTAWHCLGWVWVLIGSAGWTSRRLPRGLSALYLAGGAMALFVYLLPDMEANAAALGVVISSWQGILFWKAGWGEAPAPHQKNK